MWTVLNDSFTSKILCKVVKGKPASMEGKGWKIGKIEEQLPKKSASRLSVDCRPTVYQLSTNSSPFGGQLLDVCLLTIG